MGNIFDIYANYVFSEKELMVLILLGDDQYWLTERLRIQNHA